MSLVLGGAGEAQRRPTELVGLLSFRDGDQADVEFRLEVHELLPFDLTRELRIECVKGCKPAQSYSERMQDGYLGAIRLFDGAEHLITTWAGGSAYRVRVYRLGTNAITKVLEAGSMGAPGMRYDPDGRLVIETTLHGPEGGRANPVSVLHIWDETAGQFREQR